MANQILSDMKVLAVLTPASRSAGAAESGVIDARGYSRVLWIFHAGVNQTNGTQDVKITSSATSGGTYADVTSAALTQVTTSNDEALYMLDMPVDPAKPFMKLVDTVATAAGIAGASVVLYGGSRTLPPTQATTPVIL